MNIARPVVGYQGLVEACRARAEELGIARLEIDRLAGLPMGYSGKLLGSDGAGKKPRRLWPIGLSAILGTLGLHLILIEDEAATSRTLALRTRVDAANQRFGNKCNSKPATKTKSISTPQPEIAAPQKEPPPVSHAHLRVIQGKKKGRYDGSRKYG